MPARPAWPDLRLRPPSTGRAEGLDSYLFGALAALLLLSSTCLSATTSAQDERPPPFLLPLRFIAASALAHLLLVIYPKLGLGTALEQPSEKAYAPLDELVAHNELSIEHDGDTRWTSETDARRFSIPRRASMPAREHDRRERHALPPGRSARSSVHAAFVLLAAAVASSASSQVSSRAAAALGTAVIAVIVGLDRSSGARQLLAAAGVAAGAGGLYLGDVDGRVSWMTLGCSAIAVGLSAWIVVVLGAAAAPGMANEARLERSLRRARLQTGLAAVPAIAIAVALTLWKGPQSPLSSSILRLTSYVLLAALSDITLYATLAVSGTVHAAAAYAFAAIIRLLVHRLRPPAETPLDLLGAAAAVLAAMSIRYLTKSPSEAGSGGGTGPTPTTATFPSSAKRRHSRALSDGSRDRAAVARPCLPAARLSSAAAICAALVTLVGVAPSLEAGGVSIRPQTPLQKKLLHPAGTTGAVLGEGQDFGEYLRANIAPGLERTIWLTLADGKYAKKAVPHLAAFLDEINVGAAHGKREELVVLCQDQECVDECRKMQVYGFAGLSFNIDDKFGPSNGDLRVAVWVKMHGIHQALRAGYSVVFADGDVFFRSDPRKHMLPLSDPSWDLQIQHEGHRHMVNIGYFFQRASPTSVAFWQLVINRMMTPTWPWDQAVVNELLETFERRSPPPGQPPLIDFESPQGVRVHVLPANLFWGGHHGWTWDHETVFLHMTCAEGTWLKYFVAAANGGFQNVNGYYSEPPPILVAPPMAGTKEEILDTLRLTVAAAQLTNRSIILPLQSSYLAPKHKADHNGWHPMFAYNSDETTFVHRPYIWSTFPLEQIEKHYGVSFLEPSYMDHAVKHLAHSNPDTLLELASAGVLDLRTTSSWESFSSRLLSPLFKDKLVVRLLSNESPRGLSSHYRSWDLPSTSGRLDRLRTCRNVEAPPACDLCTGSKEDDFFDKDD